MEPNYASLDPEERLNKFLSLVSVAFGMIGLCAGLIPIIGLVISLFGIIAGIFGRRSASRKMATFGIIFCAFSMLTAFVYAIFVYIKP
jgi:D-alanyl-lipoteichoic acid acyltransferase DltB (MBOAT superfamily)